MKIQSIDKKHLCGELYGGPQCGELLYVTREGMKIRNKELRIYHVYCTAGGRVRAICNAALWTGCSPKWCPKRQAMERGLDV